ncbi:MAG: hypothetical protein EHM61_28145 [Acidobacteria bacterium]|nr:MAG: hypothetical protein EHM61_28145 [Acidobacteriota bacterium]
MISLRFVFMTFSILALASLPLQAQGEDEPEWKGSRRWADGTEIHSGHGTIPAGPSDWAKTGGGTAGLPGTGSYGFCRFLTFPGGITILYEFQARPVPDREGLYEITLRPHQLTPEQAALWRIDRNLIDAKFLQKYPAPFVVKDSEVIAIELAENPNTGQKLVDYFLVSKGKPFLRSNLERKAAQARDFRVEDVEISVVDYDLRRNESSVYRSGGGCAGRYVWISIPGVGRFTFTLAPPPAGTGFEQTALASGEQITFRHGEDLYEWLSKQKIVPGEGVFNVWMKFDQPGWAEMGFDQVGGKELRFVVGAYDGVPSVK